MCRREEEGEGEGGWSMDLWERLEREGEGTVDFGFGDGDVGGYSFITVKVPCPFEEEIKYRQQHHHQKHHHQQQYQWLTTAFNLDRGGDLYFIFTSGTTGFFL